MFLSEMGYSELVQRLFEKMTFFLVDPLLIQSQEHQQQRHLETAALKVREGTLFPSDSGGILCSLTK